MLYQRWVTADDRVFEPISTDAIADAFGRGAAGSKPMSCPSRSGISTPPQFEWDATKARDNRKKHGVAFEER